MSHRTLTSSTTEASPPDARAVVELASHAPSMRNSQPWVWSLDGPAFELYADWTRAIERTDPEGRTLLMSCGAALHHAEVAARGLGWEPVVTRGLATQGRRPDFLARVDLLDPPVDRRPAASRASSEAAADLDALVRRRTDQRRFTSWPVPAPLLQVLCSAASGHGAFAVAVTDVVEHFRIETLSSDAQRSQAADPSLTKKERRDLERAAVDLESRDGLLVICTESDDPVDWLAAGEALSALWLAAVRRELSIVPISPIVEVGSTRSSLRRDVLGDLAVPQLLLRVSWRPISAHHLTPPRRRPLETVIRP